jgi:hypothetical protein
MPKTHITSHSRRIRRVAIDGNFLDDVQIRLHSDESSKSLSYSSAPVERHHATEDEEGITLRLLALTALQLYYDGVLSADAQRSVELTVAGRLLGAFFLHWLRALPGDKFGSAVILRFGPQPAKKERPREPNAWVKALVPLKLYPKGDWEPAEEYWRESGESIEAWAKPIIKRGRRPMYEMEQVLPGVDPEDFDSDPMEILGRWRRINVDFADTEVLF